MQISQEIQKNEISMNIMEFTKNHSRIAWHKNCEIILPVDKPCDFMVDGDIVHAKKGDIVFVNERIIHRFIIKEDATALKWLLFNIKSVMNPNIKLVPIKVHIKAEEIDAIAGLREKIDIVFKLIEQETNAPKIEDNPLMQTFVAALYLILIRYFPAEKKSRTTKQYRDFHKITAYINEHFCEDINVKVLSQKLYMSRGRLSRIFMEYSDMRVGEYIDTLRVDRANQLISDGMSVTQAALESGFQSIRTFNNTYKKIKGMSPSKYIRTMHDDSSENLY